MSPCVGLSACLTASWESPAAIAGERSVLDVRPSFVINARTLVLLVLGWVGEVPALQAFRPDTRSVYPLECFPVRSFVENQAARELTQYYSMSTARILLLLFTLFAAMAGGADARNRWIRKPAFACPYILSSHLLSHSAYRAVC